MNLTVDEAKELELKTVAFGARFNFNSLLLWKNRFAMFTFLNYSFAIYKAALAFVSLFQALSRA